MSSQRLLLLSHWVVTTQACRSQEFTQWNFKVLSPGTGRTNNNHSKVSRLSFGSGCEQELTKSGPGARLCEGSAARDLQ